ncbi:Bifunctional riboflavin kinase/FMN phosphatase [Dichanthelium oligosanthes]|uniref:Bifunctional riboflavin kinase/FMN phosphatase n=1 Tax=Dichanthelium oligosanthes TaxID=888268 RepID=A0A1E5W312_9POAL|nr:Bifunctional riboflavin kinase/FMN phosphatase [Dichanthelium oligosanthes]
MAAEHQVSAVIFDLDGTILDTERATRDVLDEFLAGYGKVPDAEKEEKRLGQMYMESTTGIIRDYGLPLTVEEYSKAMHPLYLKRWQTAQPLPGVKRLVKHLHKNGIPLAIASNSVRRNIDHKLPKLEGMRMTVCFSLYFINWGECFSVILGGDQVPNGKPFPDIFLEAAKRLGVNPSSCLVIEDSVVGVKGAKAAGAKAVAVPSLQSQRKHYYIADVILYSLLDFHPELWGLPPFEDRIQGVLPIDPLLSTSQRFDRLLNNLHRIIPDEYTYDRIPDQTSGIYLGWAKLNWLGFSKVVISTGWDFSQQTVERVMVGTSCSYVWLFSSGRPVLVDFLDSPGRIETGPVKLLIVGYIRKLQSTDDILQALSITDEDRSIARDALDLPTFTEYANDLHFHYFLSLAKSL